MIRTRAWTLTHPRAVLPLPRMEVMLPNERRGDYFALSMRYVMPVVIYPHPVLKLKWSRWHGSRYKEPCIGQYKEELFHTHRSPFEYVIAVLGMLQTIQKEGR